MDAWDVMFGCSTQHLMDQLKVRTYQKGELGQIIIFRASPSSDGDDYNRISGQFIFSSGSTDGNSECVDVGILNDDVLEATEFFTFALSFNDLAVDTDIPAADVYIEDEDSKYMCTFCNKVMFGHVKICLSL